MEDLNFKDLEYLLQPPLGISRKKFASKLKNQKIKSLKSDFENFLFNTKISI